MANKDYLNEDGSMNFEKFNLLTEIEQISYMEKWTPQQWAEYRMQEPTFTEDEVFVPIFELINKYYKD